MRCSCSPYKNYKNHKFNSIAFSRQIKKTLITHLRKVKIITWAWRNWSNSSRWCLIWVAKSSVKTENKAEEWCCCCWLWCCWNCCCCCCCCCWSPKDKRRPVETTLGLLWLWLWLWSWERSMSWGGGGWDCCCREKGRIEGEISVAAEVSLPLLRWLVVLLTAVIKSIRTKFKKTNLLLIELVFMAQKQNWVTKRYEFEETHLLLHCWTACGIDQDILLAVLVKNNHALLVSFCRISGNQSRD